MRLELVKVGGDSDVWRLLSDESSGAVDEAIASVSRCCKVIGCSVSGIVLSSNERISKRFPAR